MYEPFARIFSRFITWSLSICNFEYDGCKCLNDNDDVDEGPPITLTLSSYINYQYLILWLKIFNYYFIFQLTWTTWF